MNLWILTFSFGIFTLAFFRSLPSLYWLIAVIPLFFAWFFARTKFKKKLFHVFVFACGLFWALLYAHFITAWSLAPALESKDLLVTGFIASIPAKKPHHINFEFKTETIAGAKIDTKFKLSWYGEHPKISVGDKWQLCVRLKRPHGTLNPGGFELEKYLFVHHIRATGSIATSSSNKLLSSRFYNFPLTRLRQHLLAKINQVLLPDELAPIIATLVTGAENEITQTQWQVMRATGTSYLVAISGLHIGLVASIILFFAQFFWRKIGELPLVMPAREVGIIFGLCVGFIYAAVSGFSIPTQRALVMLVMFSLVALMRRYTHAWNAWLWSLFFVLLLDPLAELTIGFWLSFLAVAAIIFVASGRIKDEKSHVKNFLSMQLTVTLALLPLTLLFFKECSLTTLFANALAMPVVCLVVVPISLLGALMLLFSQGIGTFILWVGAKILHVVWWWLTLLAHLPSTIWMHPIYNVWILLTVSVGVFLLLLPKGFPAKFLSVFWLIPLLFYTPPGPGVGEIWFTLIDVGQGLASVVRTEHHVLIYDTGPKFFDEDAGKQNVIPYLQMQGVKSVDALVVSHGDSDHIGGANSILREMQVKNIVTSVPERFVPRVAQHCFAGQSWNWDGVNFQFFSPPKDVTLSANDASCVLKITLGKNSLLLTGDIERDTEKILAESYGVNLKSTILIAPHHGSKTSSTDVFANLVAPSYVLFPVGYRNRFHFPSPEVLARYIRLGASLHDTAHEGAITFKFNGKSAILPPISYRKVEKHFWSDF